MPLLPIFESAPDSVAKMSIEQIVSAAGDGSLKDGSTCSVELRDYLGKIGTERIAEYAEHCLTLPFAKNGMVLQDLINELGRRLDYEVANGRYQGVQGQIGFDGLWTSPEQHTLVVEVKTTDAYRLSLDTLATYRSKLLDAGTLAAQSSILIVVGRQDTGELEAQIRGSRHAWDVRVISVEAMVKLVLLKENTEAPETGLKMRSLLTPIEYTRLDRMVDVMFTTATDVEEEPGPELLREAEGDGQPEHGSTGPKVGQLATVTKGTWQFTDSQLLQAKRLEIVATLARREGVSLVKKSRALYWSAKHDVRAACAISKRYTGKNQAPYWYAYHPLWETFLSDAERGYYVLGCMDLDVAFAIPHATLQPLLPLLHTTASKPGGAYWHVHIVERAGELAMAVPKGQPLPLKPFQFDVS